MSDWFDIRSAFRGVLNGIPGLPASRAWENREFTPVPGVAYIEEALLPVSEAPIGFMIEQRMIYQITLAYPSGEGTAAAEAFIDDILAAFPPNKDVGGIARVDRSERAPTYRDGAWWRLPVRVRARAYGQF